LALAPVPGARLAPGDRKPKKVNNLPHRTGAATPRVVSPWSSLIFRENLIDINVTRTDRETNCSYRGGDELRLVEALVSIWRTPKRNVSAEVRSLHLQRSLPKCLAITEIELTAAVRFAAGTTAGI
jgi:hypothetical protein